MRHFLLKSTILTVIVLMLGAISYSTFLKPFYIFILPILLFFFYGVTNLVHAWLLKIAGKSGSRFTSQYMATSFIKMFFYLLVAVVYVIFDRENTKVFIVNFLLLYVIYSVFEVTEFLKVIKQVK